MRSGRQPGQGQVALALADDLVAGGERDEVGEPLDRDGVAVADELGDGVAHRRDLGGGAHARHYPAASVAGRCRRRSDRLLDLVDRAGRGRRGQDLAVLAGDRGDRLARRAAAPVAISASVTVSAGDIRTLDLPHSRTSRPRWKASHWTSSACSAVSNSMPSIRPLPRTSRTSAGKRRAQPAEPGQRLLAARGGVVDRGRPRAARSSRAPRRRRSGCRRRSSRGRPGPRSRGARPGRPCAPSGHARRDALGRQQDVGLDAPVLDRPHLAGPSGAGLDLVGDEQDPVLVADPAQALRGSRPRGRCSRPRPGSARR